TRHGQRRGIDTFHLERVHQPEGADEIDQRVGAAQLVQMKLCLRYAMNRRFGTGDEADGVERVGLHPVGSVRLLDHPTQRGHRPLDAPGHVDGDARAARVTALLTTHFDVDLVAQPERLDCRVEHRALGAGVDQGAQRHVAGDAGKAVEVRDGHARVLLMWTAAASMGCMLGGRLATRTVTPSTRGSSRTRRAISPASDSSSRTGGPSITSLTALRTLV